MPSCSKYITTLVPYWRVSDEAWPIGDDHLVGIGVLRKYGGQVIVLPWDDNASSRLARLRGKLGPVFDKVVVVVDDRTPGDIGAIEALLEPIAVVPWSRRAELEKFIIKDTPDGPPIR